MPLPPLLLARERSMTGPRLDRDAALRRVRAGAYVDDAAWRSLAAWDRYRVRVLAVHATWTAPVFCLESAASLLGLPLFGEPRFVHLLDPGGRSWREGDVVVHGTRDERSIRTLDGGIQVTALSDAVLDLARVMPPAFGLAIADAAGRLGAADLDLSAKGRAQSNRRGVRTLDWIEPRIDTDAESPGESVSRAVIEWLGYEAPESQVRFAYEGEHDRSDFYWRRRRIVGESDGYGKYDASDPAAMKEHFVREKRREDRLRRHEGGFARWDWSDTMRADPLDRALRAAGLEPIAERNRAGLATLAVNPRSLHHRRAST